MQFSIKCFYFRCVFLSLDSNNKFVANSFPTKELAFDLTSHNKEVEKLILTSDEDEEGVLATMDKGAK